MENKLFLTGNQYFNIIGPDGSGKSALMKKILPVIDNYISIREPGGTKEAERIREAILSIEEQNRVDFFNEFIHMDFLDQTFDLLKKAKMYYEENDITMMEVFLYAAARSEIHEKVIKKSLKSGKTVIGSRSISCSMAYQVGARGADPNVVWGVNQDIMHQLPNFEIYLDLPVEVAMKRISGRTEKQDRLDLETKEFHKKSHEGYKNFFKQKKFPVFIVDATKTESEVFEQTMNIIKSNLL